MTYFVSNRETAPARNFHEATKLVYINLANKPPLYKSYPSSPQIPLPTDFSLPQLSALRAIAGESEPSGEPLSLKTVASLLYHSAGVIRKAVHPTAGEVHYRAASSAGALYPVETYLVCQDLPGLSAGVYHFSPAKFSLRQLRDGDCRQLLVQASGDEPAVIDAPATLIFTTMFWRSAWKYRARGYRYCYWDTGTVLANLLAATTASGLSARVVAGFVDAQLDQLLGIDGLREATACLVPLGVSAASAPTTAPAWTPVPPAGGTDFAGENKYPESEELHAASRLGSHEAVTSWRCDPSSTIDRSQSSAYSESPNHAAGQKISAEAATLSEAILDRGSTRRFAREPIPATHLNTALEQATRRISADFLGNDFSSLVDIYAIVNSVDGLPPGAYFYSPREKRLELLRAGDFREECGHLGFEQALPADASTVLFLMTDLEAVLARFGNRGYRVAQMEAGILGGKMYLAAHALGFGATGLTFYDDAITEFFSPHAVGKSTMFVMPLGRKAPINRVRPFRSKVAAKLDALARGAGQNPSEPEPKLHGSG